MGAKVDFIRQHVVGHVVLYDNALIAAALEGCEEEDCRVDDYGTENTPTHVSFRGRSGTSPLGGNLWIFQRIGNWLPDHIPYPPRSITKPFWQFGPRPFEPPMPPGHQGRRRVAR